MLGRAIKRYSYWIVFFAIMLMKYGYYRFRYYPVLDDWIQYGVFSFSNNIFKEIIIGTGTYTTRPFASLSDPYIWARFWGKMGIAFFIITCLHILSGYLLYKVFEYHELNVGLLFLAIFGMLPLGTEATYWISASSRLVVGIFFMALSLYLLSLYIRKNQQNYWLLLFFFLTHLISLGYYESIIVLSVFSAVLLIILNWRLLKKKWVAVIPIVNFFMIAVYYKSFSHVGQVAARGQFIKENYISHFRLVFDKIMDVWIKAHLPLYTRGFVRGLKVLLENHSYLYLFLILLLSVVAAVLASREKNGMSKKDAVIKIVIGVILFWVPFSIHFILSDVWISNRNAFPSLIGLGLIMEGLLTVFTDSQRRKYVKSIVIAILVPVLMIIHISELTDYKNISEADRLICTNIINAAKGTEFLEGKKKAFLFNTVSAYVEQNMHYHEHIHNVTEADWSLTGVIRAVSRNRNIHSMKPVPNEQSFSMDDINSFDLFGIDSSMNVFPLYAEEDRSDGKILLKRENGEPFGFIQKEDTLYRFYYIKS